MTVRTLGLYSRTGSAVAVALDDGAALVGRWALDLTEDRVPRQAYHVAADLPPAEAEALVRRCIDTVTRVAARRLAGIVAEVGPVDAVGVVVGDRPVPDSVAVIVAAHPLMHAAEGQLYRDALLDAAAALGIPAVGLARQEATARLAGALAGRVRALGAAAGPPWRKEQKLAVAAAVAAVPVRRGGNEREKPDNRVPPRP
jgi:hypothetical protein